MTVRAALAVVLALIVFGVSSCGSGGDSTEAETEAEPTATTAPAEAPAPSAGGENLERSAKVEIVNFEYGPDPVQVQAGGKVIWSNQDSVPHTATADDGSFDTGTIEEGKLKSESFKQ